MGNEDYDNSWDMENFECSTITLNRWLRRVHASSLRDFSRPRFLKVKDCCRKVIESLELGDISILGIVGLDTGDAGLCEFIEEWLKLENCFLASTFLLGLHRDEETRELVFLPVYAI